MSKLKERGEGLVTMNAHAKYKSPSSAVSAVMVKVKVFVHSHVQANANADTGMTIALPDIRSGEHKRENYW